MAAGTAAGMGIKRVLVRIPQGPVGPRRQPRNRLLVRDKGKEILAGAGEAWAVERAALAVVARICSK